MSGRLKQRSYETREGEKRTVVELDVDEIGASLRYATAKVHRTTRGNSSGPARELATVGAPSNDAWAANGSDDPWAHTGSFGGQSDDPVF